MLALRGRAPGFKAPGVVTPVRVDPLLAARQAGGVAFVDMALIVTVEVPLIVHGTRTDPMAPARNESNAVVSACRIAEWPIDGPNR